MDCGELLTKYSRYLLIIFNFVFALTGVLILSVGASIKAYYHEYGSLLDNKFIYASDLLIAIGVIIFIISFFGCCGALKQSACLTLTFSTFLIVIFVLELFVGIGGILLKHKTEDVIDTALRRTMNEYNMKNASEITDLWDQIQIRFKCCGVDGPYNWKNDTNATQGELPVSCCKIISGTTGGFNCTLDYPGLYKDGCLTLFGDYIRGHASSMEGVGLGLAIIQLLGIVMSCYLSKQIKSGYETV